MKSAYTARCHKRLREWGALLENWYCIDVSDTESSCYTCEHHDEYFEDVHVGCVCAGVMESDILAAKERERLIKNRARRRAYFPRRKWKDSGQDGYLLIYEGEELWLRRGDRHWSVSYKNESRKEYKGRPIINFLSAAYAAFDLVDPPIKVA